MALIRRRRDVPLLSVALRLVTLEKRIPQPFFKQQPVRLHLTRRQFARHADHLHECQRRRIRQNAKRLPRSGERAYKTGASQAHSSGLEALYLRFHP